MSAHPGSLERWGVRVVGYDALEGRPGFKLGIHTDGERWHLYTGHLWHRGWSIVDVTEPAEPRMARFVPGPDHTWTTQVQVADSKLLTALERPPPGWGVDTPEKAEEGAMIWDLSSDPTRPELLGVHRTGGAGTHRNFYAGGGLAYLAADLPEVHGRALQIVDVSAPERPREVGRWSWPGQDRMDGEGLESYMHGPAHVVGTIAYVSYGRAGLVILDVADPTRPELVGHLSFGDLGSRIGCHSAVPIPDTDLLIANGEAIAEGREGEWNYVFVVDVSDVGRPRVVGEVPPPRPGGALPYRTYHDKGGRFGPHNQHHHQDGSPLMRSSTTLYMTWFNAGLRVYDLSDPMDPRETGCFVPVDPVVRRGPLPKTLVTQFEDVLVDARGFIYCTDKNHGLYVLALEGPAGNPRSSV